MTRPTTRRLVAAALAVVLSAGAPGSLGPTASAAPELPPSVGNSVLFHLQLAADIDQYGNPIGQGNVFPEGTTLIFGLLGWNYVPVGTELRLRLFQGDRFVYETSHVVVNETGPDGESAGFLFPLNMSVGFPAGDYYVEVDYNRVPDEIVPFTVGSGSTFDPVLGTGAASGPIPYKRPSEVLVVTRASVLRANLGSRANEVLAAAGRVGDLHDLDAGGVTRDTPDKAADEVQRLLRSRPYKYLLIVGNDDAVPYFHVENPLADSEAAALADWELPSDWVATDNFYTDLDADDYGVPDMPIARIPSSDDADLLLTQLGEIADSVQVRLQYAPPVDAQSFGTNPDAENARYLYVLLHGIGVLTNAWSANTVTWQPSNMDDPLSAEWILSESYQQDAVTAETDPTSRGVVQIGACYGAWTMDTKQAPVHKTADNNLALHYLKGGSRAYIADTHLSYSTVMGASDAPRGRTGFELLFWRGIGQGMAPIDAFQAAKV
ncbi:MAG: C25 family cysteine peptidase, partial [Chloroflexi bacterium]|nr:C25 family cysteine peptidase [Chloroflexota bacterium]